MLIPFDTWDEININLLIKESIKLNMGNNLIYKCDL